MSLARKMVTSNVAKSVAKATTVNSIVLRSPAHVERVGPSTALLSTHLPLTSRIAARQCSPWAISGGLMVAWAALMVAHRICKIIRAWGCQGPLQPLLLSPEGAVSPSPISVLATSGKQDTLDHPQDPLEDPKEDPMVRDGKQLPMAGTKAVVPFLVTIFIKVPLLSLVLIPGAVVWQLLSAPFATKKKSVPCVAQASEIAAQSKPLAERPLDIVLVGATGFTGRLAALYLARQYGTSIKWAIAGRQRSKLEAVHQELCAINADLKDLPIIVVDTLNSDQLPAIVNECRVVLSTVGPYASYGGPLVRACALYGTSYCDITGEFTWVRKMVDQFDDVARQSGARIVHFCGCDCVPTDIMTLQVAKTLKEKTGETLNSIDFYDEMSGGVSGGTVATIATALEMGNEKYPSQLGYDPLLKTLQGAKGDSQVKSLCSNFIKYSSQVKRWTGPFIMSQVNFNCLRRSNALNGYGQVVKFNESLVYPNFMAAVCNIVDLTLFFCILLCKPLQFLLPRPGAGPSEKSQAKGFLRLTALGKGDRGGQVKGVLYYPTDIGYSSTARMLVEAGLTLLDPNVSTTGGVFTPASCLGTTLLHRLVATGCWYHMGEVKVNTA